jgi:hypothetical protein
MSHLLLVYLLLTYPCSELVDAIADINVVRYCGCCKRHWNVLGSAATVTVNLLGTAGVVADMAILATVIYADMNTLATADVVNDMNVLGTADVVSDMNTLGTAPNVTNMNTLLAYLATSQMFRE